MTNSKNMLLSSGQLDQQVTVEINMINGDIVSTRVANIQSSITSNANDISITALPRFLEGTILGSAKHRTNSMLKNINDFQIYGFRKLTNIS